MANRVRDSNSMPCGVLVSALDNLLKGAASSAVQNMNRVFSHPETEGLA